MMFFEKAEGVKCFGHRGAVKGLKLGESGLTFPQKVKWSGTVLNEKLNGPNYIFYVQIYFK